MWINQEIINYPTELHLVSHFCILYHDALKHEYQGCGVVFGLLLFMDRKYGP